MGTASEILFSYTAKNLGDSRGGQGARDRRTRGGFLFVTLSPEGAYGKVRDARGRFISAQRQVGLVNARLSTELAELMVTKLENSIVRPNVSTSRLARALLDPRNRRSDLFGFDVGKISYLDHSEAKYWRAIELGTRHFLGKKISGVFGDTLTGGARFGKRYGYYPEAGPAFEAFGTGNQGRLLPLGRAGAYKLLRQNSASGKAAGAVQGIIRRPITPHYYMRNAWKEFDIKSRAPGIVKEVFTNAGLPVPKRR